MKIYVNLFRKNCAIEYTVVSRKRKMFKKKDKKDIKTNHERM